MAENQTNLLSRKDSYKQTMSYEERKSKRATTTLKISKEKREGQVMKKRQQATAELVFAPTALPLIEGGRTCYIESDVDILIQYVSHPNLAFQLEATRGLRRLASKNGNSHCMKRMADSGILHKVSSNLRLFSGISNENNPEGRLVLESAWLLSFIAGNFPMEVADAGAIDPLVQLFRNKNTTMRSCSAICLGNIAADNVTLRDQIFSHNVMDPLIQSLKHPSTLEELVNVVFCAAQLCRGQPPPNYGSETKSIVWCLAERFGALIHLHQEGLNPEKMDEILTNVLWIFSYLSNGKTEQIENVLSTGVLPSLMQLGNNPKFQTVALVKTLANFASGNESQKQAVLNAGVIQLAGNLLVASSSQTRKEVFCMLSRIAEGNRHQAGHIIGNAAIMESIVNAASNESMPIRKEALWTLCNLCNGDRPRFLSLINAGGLKSLVDFLPIATSEIDLLGAVLDAIEAILKDGSTRPGEGYLQLFETYGGINHLEDLQEHSCDEIYEKIVYIIQTYFGVEEEDENLAPAVSENGAFKFGFAQPSPSQLSPQAPAILFGDNGQQQPSFYFGSASHSNSSNNASTS